jgi:hypothetical protein
VPFHPAKTWRFAIQPPIEVLAEMAYGSGMKNQAIESRDFARSEQSWDRFKGRLNHNENEEENSANECGGKVWNVMH